MANRINDITRIMVAKEIIDTLGDTFTKKEYDNARPSGSATIDWLEGEGIITFDHKETFEKEVAEYSAYSNHTEDMMVLADGRTLCSKDEWDDYNDVVKQTIITANGGTPRIEARVPKITITCSRYFWKLNEGNIELLLDKWLNEALEYAELKVAELEPKLKKYIAILDTYGE